MSNASPNYAEASPEEMHLHLLLKTQAHIRKNEGGQAAEQFGLRMNLKQVACAAGYGPLLDDLSLTKAPPGAANAAGENRFGTPMQFDALPQVAEGDEAIGAFVQLLPRTKLGYYRLTPAAARTLAADLILAANAIDRCAGRKVPEFKLPAPPECTTYSC